MTTLPPIHLCVIQPAGYVHWMALLDPLRYFRWQLRRLGVRVTVAKNRLRHDAVNLVFGAHLGFDADLRRRYTCLFVNLEQIGEGGAQTSAEYLQLLSTSGVVDYDARNVAAYAADPQDVPIVPVLHAPYLAEQPPLAFEDRPIDLLFIGSMNERRARWLRCIEATGRTVTLFDAPLYGAERDRFIRQAKAVVNVHFYDSCRFEQVRAAHCLSLGTPLISERTATTCPHEAFEDCVLWLKDAAEIEQFFTEDFATPAYYDAVGAAVERFRGTDPVEAYADLAAFVNGYAQGYRRCVGTGDWRPRRIQLGSGRDYRPGWLNIDVDAAAEPDTQIDLSQSLALPLRLDSPSAGPCVLEADSVDLIHAAHVLQCVADLPAVMGNCLKLLREDGEMHIDVPCEGAPTAWQDPHHVRALNAHSWRYVTDWFWYLGWYEHRFALDRMVYLDAAGQPCEAGAAALMRVVLRKVATSPAERMHAQAMQPQLRLPDDAFALAVPSNVGPQLPPRGAALAVNG
jgi:SAM-dependent methyltransferase